MSAKYWYRVHIRPVYEAPSDRAETIFVCATSKQDAANIARRQLSAAGRTAVDGRVHIRAERILGKPSRYDGPPPELAPAHCRTCHCDRMDPVKTALLAACEAVESGLSSGSGTRWADALVVVRAAIALARGES